MVPSAIYLHPLPRLPNLKIDRQALERQDTARASDLSARERDPILDKVAGAFETVIGCSGATGEDDLLSLGGDSLQAVEVMLELERRFGVPAPQDVFRSSRSIAELAAWLAKRGALDVAGASP
jgi:acyl carrier protein